MQISSFFFFFSLLASAFATTLYRGDKRTPETIKNDGGFKATGYTNPQQVDLCAHVAGKIKVGKKSEKIVRDPYISTSTDIDVSKKFAGVEGYVYTLDSTKITEQITDVDAHYKTLCKQNIHADEKEMAVEKFIPWAAVTHIQQEKDGFWETVTKPTKRAIEFGVRQSGDVFAAPSVQVRKERV